MSLFCALIPAQGVYADDLDITAPYIPSLLNLEYGIDSDKGRDVLLFASLMVTAEDRVSLTYGRRDETVSGTLEALNTQTYGAGYAFHSAKKFRIGVDFEHWGEENKITTDTLSVFLALDFRDLTFTVSPQYRRIDVFVQADCESQLDNTAIALDAKYFPNKKFALSAGYVTLDYSKDREALLACAESQDIPLLVGRLKSVADDKQILLGMNYFRNTESFGLDWARVESAIDGDISNIWTVYIATNRVDDWTIGLTAGTQENYDDTTTDFVKVMLTYYW
ncbi:MAG TPA: hypothetical protein VIM41_14180 [Gammaproteobacteria bacterium]